MVWWFVSYIVTLVVVFLVFLFLFYDVVTSYIKFYVNCIELTFVYIDYTLLIICEFGDKQVALVAMDDCTQR